jgi:hypothetical protein
VQQRLRRDAADIEAHPAKRRPAIDQHDPLAEIGGAEGGAVTARSGAQHQHLGVKVAADPTACYTVAISNPMMPPPSTSSRLGMPSTSKAPVLSMTRGPSCGIDGRVSGSDPAAMIA